MDTLVWSPYADCIFALQQWRLNHVHYGINDGVLLHIYTNRRVGTEYNSVALNSAQCCNTRFKSVNECFVQMSNQNLSNKRWKLDFLPIPMVFLQGKAWIWPRKLQKQLWAMEHSIACCSLEEIAQQGNGPSTSIGLTAPESNKCQNKLQIVKDSNSWNWKHLSLCYSTIHIKPEAQ